MEKLNLNAIAKEYHANEVSKARERAAELVKTEILPMLTNAAKAGQYQCKIEIRRSDVFVSDVQTEICKMVQCKVTGYGKTFTVHW